MDEKILKMQLRALEESHLKPAVRTSVEELNQLLADDFFEFGSSGGVTYKRDCLVEGGVGVRDSSLYDFEMHSISRDAVLTTYRVRDADRQQDTLRSSLWKYIDGRWQLFFHQGTVVKK